ncbi:hypothetical protein [Nocardia panacis]|nr:hypothetical protein [Nocardia panacis]
MNDLVWGEGFDPTAVGMYLSLAQPVLDGLRQLITEHAELEAKR